MKIVIDIDFIQKLGISIHAYTLLFLLYYGEKVDIVSSPQLIISLEKAGYIKDQETGLILRKKAIDLFSNKISIKDDKLEAFVDKYRDLFPIGVKSGGRLIRGDKQGCISKFKSFKNKYPEYTQEEILDATKAFLDGKKKVNYDKCTSADYFIIKDGLSMLASYCEDIRLRGNKFNDGRTKQSEDI